MVLGIGDVILGIFNQFCSVARIDGYRFDFCHWCHTAWSRPSCCVLDLQPLVYSSL